MKAHEHYSENDPGTSYMSRDQQLDCMNAATSPPGRNQPDPQISLRAGLQAAGKIKPAPLKGRAWCLAFLSGTFALFAHLLAHGQAQLGIQTYAGLTITGSVGTVYSIECATDLSPTNWSSLEFLQLPATPHFWVDKSAPATGQRFYRATVVPAPTNMVFIPPGTFRMGSSEEENPSPSGWEKPQTAVTISRGYWMARFEVTQAEYQRIMGNNPSYWKGTDRPVDNVSWSSATNYCGKLTLRERAAGRIPPNTGFRLPTEAEWEYACRAWTSTRFSYAEDPDYLQLGNYAWYSANSPDGTSPVGQLLPNPWGLYDMHGNLWEWCLDWWEDSLPGGTVVDPTGPAAGTKHVIRGGAYAYWMFDSRSASRWNSDPAGWPAAGFRVVLSVVGQP